jgi:lipopolysaccharide export LptBFGC system permease protein LptF
MVKQNPTYRLIFLILVTMFSVVCAAIKFYDFAENKIGMKLIAGIVFGVIAIVYSINLIGFIKNIKALKAGHE